MATGVSPAFSRLDAKIAIGDLKLHIFLFESGLDLSSDDSMSLFNG